MVISLLSNDGEKMFSEECVRAALSDLVQYHGYEIQEINYSEEHFGNFVIKLAKANSFNIRFLRDRGQVWCEIGRNSNWMQLEDVLTVVGAKFEFDQNDDYCRIIKLISSTIHDWFTLLNKALEDNNCKATIKQVEQMKQNRVREFLGEFQQNQKA